jgi:transcriptional regulator with XRE-family HTH domain
MRTLMVAVPADTAAGAAPALQEQVLSKAVVRAADHLGLTNRLLAEVLGLSEPTVSRLRRGNYRLQRGAKPFELAQLLLRLFRSLDAINGSDDEASRSWLRSDNRALSGRPIDLIRSVTGLIDVAAYLESRRALV